jgi:hypothetical protein
MKPRLYKLRSRNAYTLCIITVSIIVINYYKLHKIGKIICLGYAEMFLYVYVMGNIKYWVGNIHISRAIWTSNMNK